MSDTPDTPDTRMRVDDVLESLTGFEVIAIEDQHGGVDFTELSGTKLTIALVAMLRKREGMSSKDAWQAARSLTLGQLNEQFAPATSTLDELAGHDDPAGKDDTGSSSANASGPNTSSASARGSRPTISAA